MRKLQGSKQEGILFERTGKKLADQSQRDHTEPFLSTYIHTSFQYWFRRRNLTKNLASKGNKVCAQSLS